MIHILELVRPARQNVGEANLDFRADAFDTRGNEERTANTLLATATATRRRKEDVRLERSNILLDITRKRFRKAIERARGHVRHRLNAIAQTHVEVYRRKNARRQQNHWKKCTKIHHNHPLCQKSTFYIYKVPKRAWF